MSATVYWPAAWKRARDRRAMKGKGPRIAIRRSIVLRETAGGWIAAIYVWRRGCWDKPEWLCQRTALSEAREVALAAWEQHRLPMLWAYADETFVRPFYPGLNEPEARP